MSKILELAEIARTYIVQNWNSSRVLYSVLCAYGLYKAIYYAFFDRLRNIPGPFFTRFSSYPTRKALFSGEYTRYLLSLHKKYGPVVRIAPNRLSDSNASDFKKVMASYKFRKSSTYEIFSRVHQSIFSTRDEEFNRMRRRQVGPAFSQTGLDSVEYIIDDICTDTFIKKLNEIIDDGNGSAQFNYFKYFQNLTADVIGELVFGERFHAVENNGHPITDWVNAAMRNSIIYNSFLPLKILRSLIPSLSAKETKLYQFCLDAIKNRQDQIKNGKFNDDRIDILQMYLVAINSSNNKPLSNNELIAEMVTMMVAGVDTTSIIMTWLMTYYMIYPKVYQRVVDEVRENFPKDGHKIKYKEAREKLPYFVATVYETMRIKGSTGGTLAREVPKEGVNLSGYYIPQGVDIAMFIAGAHEDTQVWGDNLNYNPDRFMGPESKKFKKEILAFSTGIRICPGRNLAWMEIFTIIPNLIKNFDLSFPPNSLYGPNILDPNNGNEPLVPKDISFATRFPANPDRDCNLVITKHISQL
ncbi:Versicolorin B desaturase [Smittium mucronatum]|uniref:Versicolorin B desaturase n=1 Tax=Smittium mucronatum TaxID=133383 RepID=A0A1R0H0D5_9FUNG|nr:Versicolorin B desaturase [Smittium mucronatum]